MNTESKLAKLITKLIRETSNGNISWELSNVPLSLNTATEQSVPLFLQTDYKGKIIGIYDLRSKHYTDIDEYSWTRGVGLCIVDDQGRVTWEAKENLLSLYDLFNIAREQASGIDDILDNLLDD